MNPTICVDTARIPMHEVLLNIPHVKPIVLFRFDDEWIRELLAVQYAPYVRAMCAGETHTLEATIHKVDSQQYFVQLGGREPEMIPGHEVFTAIKKWMHQVLEPDAGYLLMHGAAVAHNGKALLFLGGTGSGKSTLTSYLAAQGLAYITDDVLIVDAANQMLHPYAKPIHIRLDAYRLLCGRYGCEIPEKGFRHGQFIRKIWLPPCVATSTMPISAIFLLSLCSDMDVSLGKIHDTAILVKRNYGTKNIAASISPAIQLAKQIPIYKLTYWNLEQASVMLQACEYP